MAVKKSWYQQKSFWLGFTAISGGVAGILTGTVDLENGIEAIGGGLALIFMRDAIEGAK